MAEEKGLSVIKTKAEGMSKMLEKFQVVDDKSMELVADKIKEVKMLGKFIKQKKDEYVAPAKAIIETAKTDYDPYIKMCENAEITLKDRAVKYHDKIEKERKIEEDKIAKKAESGYIKTETAMTKMEALPEVQKTVRTDNNSKLSFAKVKKATIVNPELIPDIYWVIDEVRVRREALLRDKGGLEQIPGVVISEETSAGSR
jgi:hypothetical protein